MGSKMRSKTGRGNGKAKDALVPPSTKPPPPDNAKQRTKPSSLGRAVKQPYSSSQPTSAAHVPVHPKLLKRFYEALLVLHMLGKYRGDRSEEEAYVNEPDSQDLAPHELRRAFIRNLAYLCDFKRGGDSVTAIALEQTPQGVVYHLASNKCPSEDPAKGFLHHILSILQQVETIDPEIAEAEIFKAAVNLSSARILDYREALNRNIHHILQQMDSQSEEDSTLKKWLLTLCKVAGDAQSLCRHCYEERHSPTYASLQRRARNGAPQADKYENIRHLIGRLNHTMKAVGIIISASVSLPRLLDDFSIVREPSPPSSPPPLKERHPTLLEIAGRMIGNPAEMAHLKDALGEMDRLFGLEIALQREYARPTWQPRVHAELLLLNKFLVQEAEFVDGDRYIGCSKPACYCCRQYIAAHGGGFVVPACHNNVWLDWRPPDVVNGDVERLVKREYVLKEMVKHIRRDALKQIEARRGPYRTRPDSLTEISSLGLGGLRLSEFGEVGLLRGETCEENPFSDENLSGSDAGSESPASCSEDSDDHSTGGGVSLV